jgi:flagellar FliL protein
MSDAKQEEAPTKGGKKKLVFLIVLLLVLAGGGGGVAWWFLGRGEPDEEAVSAKAEAARKATRAFVTLEPFVVNLSDGGSERYAQVGIVLEVEGKEANQKVADRMPAVRNDILLLISSKQARELVTREGKEQLALEIAEAAGKQIGWIPPDDEEEPEPPKSKGNAKQAKPRPPKKEPPPNPVGSVHFSSFIVQ